MKKWWEEKRRAVGFIFLGMLLAFICMRVGSLTKKCPTCPETERVYIGYPIDQNSYYDIVIDSTIIRVNLRPYLKVYSHPDSILVSKIVPICALNPKSFNLSDLMDVMQTYYRWGYDYTHFLKYLSAMHRDRRAIELCKGTGFDLNILWYNVNWKEMTGEK